jgi:hypothetical protein
MTATSLASVRKSRVVSCRRFPVNRTAKDSLRHFGRTNNEFLEMRPKSNTRGMLKAPEIQITAASTTRQAAWSHQTSVALMTHSRKTYCCPAFWNGGEAAALHIGEEVLFQAHYTIISWFDSRRLDQDKGFLRRRVGRSRCDAKLRTQ